MTTLLYCLSIVLMISLPVVVAILLRRRFRTLWLMFVVGVLTFTVSQVFHIPFNNWLTDLGLLPEGGSLAGPPLWQTALILGLSAGVFEELVRAGGFWLLKRYRRFEDGVMMGLGHGGIEAMVFGGVLTAASISELLFLQGVDLNTLGLSPERLAALSGQIELFAASPWLAAAPLLERGLAMTAQVIFSLLVWRAFQRRNVLYLLAAIGYHAAIDGVAVYVLMQTEKVWLVEAVFLVSILPGLVWLWRTWPRKADREPHPVPLVSTEWRAFFTALRKELLQQWRTKRLLVVLVVFVLFGLMSPLIAKFTPEILGSLEGAEMFADLIPTPTAADGMAQYVKNLTQFGFIIALLLGMGAVAEEKERGTAPMILSKPMPRWAFVLSKFTAQALVYALGFGIASLGAYYYTLILFGPFDFGAFMFMNLLLLLWLLTFVAVTMLGSVLGNTTGSAAGIGLVGAVVLLLAGSLPRVGALAPGGLVAWASQLGAGMTEIPANGGAAAMAVVIILVGLIAAVGVFENQES